MCAIAGVLEINSQRVVERNVLETIVQTMIHRGPDDEGIYLEDNVGLGNRRLSIIDMESGHQPIHNEDKNMWIVFNGEIYNFPQLRANLIKKGHRFYTKTDTETALHLYEDKGEDCVKELDGMFAFAIWDGKKRELFLARDPRGKKPLHYVLANGRFIFASEIKGILACPGFQNEIDRRSLAKYFLYGFVPAPETIFEGIKKLRPGHFMVVSGGGEVGEEKYWEIDYSKKTKATEEEVKKEVVRLLGESVKKRLISDVPLGVFLSGGVDSSLVTAMMARLIPPSRVQSFSIGFEEKEVDELPYAKMVANHLGVNHRFKILSRKEISDLVPKIPNFLDEPMADPSILPTFLLSAFARENVKVVLSGDGGDESFAGYPKYLAHLLLEKTRLGKIPLNPLARVLPGKLGKFFEYSSYPLHLRNQLWISPFSPGEVEELTGEKVSFRDIKGYHRLFHGEDPLDEAFFLDQELTLPDLYLVKTDRASMANSLEVRCPFLDKELVEFCARIPFELKLKGFHTKTLLKEIALEFLPKEAILRPKKGFGIPLEEWLGGELKTLVEEMLNPQKIRSENLLNEPAVAGVLRRNDPIQIWTLLVFELWWEKWMKN